MAAPLSADQELKRLTARSNAALTMTINEILKAKIEREDDREWQFKLREQLSQVLALGSLLGRRRVLIQTKAKARGHKLEAASQRSGYGGALFSADIISPFVPLVVFEEAVADIFERHPTLAVGYKEVQQRYMRGHAFALAKSTDLTLTKKVQTTLAKAVRSGADKYKTVDLVASLGDWSRAYSEVVYETNTCSAYSAGVIAQSNDPDVMEVCPAMSIIGRQTEPSRPNHIACVGFVAGVKDPDWNVYATPLGYRCTHGMNQVDRWELKERGLLAKDGSVKQWRPPGFNSKAGPDPGFGHSTLAQRGLV